MANPRSPLNRWIHEYCSPVVVLVTSPEVDNICLRNGMLFHEILTAFAHLDQDSASIRAGNQLITIQNAYIRFERLSEVRMKSTGSVEEALAGHFDDCQVSKVPASAAEVRAAPTSAWNTTMEQIVTKGMSFSEYELMSQPYLFISVISSTEADPVARMTDLSSLNNVPTCYATGQYEPDIQRLYLVLHDFHENRNVETKDVLHKLQSKFPAAQTRCLTINSLSSASVNQQQPDMWSMHLCPLFYPEHAPSINDVKDVHRNPHTGKPVLGSRLSIEDFMTIKDFCSKLFRNDLLPLIERRMATLTKIVSDSRKGMKNVLKSFWRKPREETSNSRSPILYKFDRIESQILCLADGLFAYKDYDGALSMYKLVRDDFKSDRSNVHLAYTLFMMVICSFLIDSNRTRDVLSHVDAFSQHLSSVTEPPHVLAFFSMMLNDVFNHPTYQMHLESSQILLQVAAATSRYPTLSGLLVEKAAENFMFAGHSRRYVLHKVLSGFKFKSAGGLPAKYSLLSFADALVLHDNGRWGDVRAKLCLAVCAELKSSLHITDDASSQRALVASLRMIRNILNEEHNISGRDALTIAISELRQLMWEQGPWNSCRVGHGWQDISTRQLLMSSIPVSNMDNDEKPVDTFEVHGFVIPDIVKASISLLVPLNSTGLLVPLDGHVNGDIMPSSLPYRFDPREITCSKKATSGPSLLFQLMQAEELKRLMLVETLLAVTHSKSSTTVLDMPSLDAVLKNWVDAEHEMQSQRYKYFNKNYRTTMLTITASPMSPSSLTQTTKIPLGEFAIVCLQIKNRLPFAMNMYDVKLFVDPADTCEVYPIEISLAAKESKEVILFAKPTIVGHFHIDSLQYRIGEKMVIREQLKVPGQLLQKTLKQRLERHRAEDTRLKFEVVSNAPLIRLTACNIPATIMSGEIISGQIRLKNEGLVAARDIRIKSSHPCFVFAARLENPGRLKEGLLPFTGHSCTVVSLPSDMVIEPNQEIVLDVWMRITALGQQNISLLAAYNTHDSEGEDRNSFLCIQLVVIPSVSCEVHIVSKPSSPTHRTILLDVTNDLVLDHTTLIHTPDNSPDLAYPEAEGDEVHLEEGQCMVESIWMLGSGELSKRSKVHTSKCSTKASSSERISICLPIEIPKESSTQPPKAISDWFNRREFANEISSHKVSENKQIAGNLSWPLNNQLPSKRTAIIEKFLSSHISSGIFIRELGVARIEKAKSDEDAENSGPRTISQVRKERQREQGDNTGTNAEGGSEKFCNDENKLALTAETLAQLEANEGCVTLIVLWSMKFRNVIHRGLLMLNHVSMLSVDRPIMRQVSRKDMSHPYTAADKLLVGIKHPRSATLSESMLDEHDCYFSPFKYAQVPVEVELRSVSNKTLMISIEAVDKKEKQKPVENTASASNFGEVPGPEFNESANSSMSTGSIAKSSFKGLTWHGKTKHLFLKVEPFSKIHVPFLAIISKTGVFDVKRFKISVSESDSTESNHGKVYFKSIQGQCLVEVTN